MSELRALEPGTQRQPIRLCPDEFQNNICLAIERGLEAALMLATPKRSEGGFCDPSNAGRRFIPLLLDELNAREI